MKISGNTVVTVVALAALGFAAMSTRKSKTVAARRAEPTEGSSEFALKFMPMEVFLTPGDEPEIDGFVLPRGQIVTKAV